jgi:hypothetical protein
MIGHHVYAQEGQRQSEINENKINELQSILYGLRSELKQKSADSIPDLYATLARIERKIDSLKLSITTIENNSIIFSDSGCGFDKQTAMLVLQKFAAFIAAEQKSNKSTGSSKTSGTSLSNGPFYVVIEAQRTLAMAQKALDMLKEKGYSDLGLVYSSGYNFYYIVVPGVFDRAGKSAQVNSWRAKGFKMTWWVAESDVSKVR